MAQKVHPNISIIDIGSNSTKLLVTNKLGAVYEAVVGNRMGEGVGKGSPLVLSEAVIQRGVECVKKLLAQTTPYSVKKHFIIATNAIRVAENSACFCDKIKSQTGVEVQVLSGEQEALMIAQGVRQDPHLKAKQNFCLFDLGGGSLECIDFQEGEVCAVKSLPLGSVRLAEEAGIDMARPISKSSIKKIEYKVEEVLQGFPHRGVPLVGVSGSLSSARKILSCEAFIKTSDLEALLEKVCELNLQERVQTYKIPEFRADILPIALATILGIAGKGGITEIIHASFNLRVGFAQRVFSQDADLIS